MPSGTRPKTVTKQYVDMKRNQRRGNTGGTMISSKKKRAAKMSQFGKVLSAAKPPVG